jgi:hypothetical protein
LKNICSDLVITNIYYFICRGSVEQKEDRVNDGTETDLPPKPPEKSRPRRSIKIHKPRYATHKKKDENGVPIEEVLPAWVTQHTEVKRVKKRKLSKPIIKDEMKEKNRGQRESDGIPVAETGPSKKDKKRKSGPPKNYENLNKKPAWN